MSEIYYIIVNFYDVHLIFIDIISTCSIEKRENVRIFMTNIINLKRIINKRFLLNNIPTVIPVT